jgi:adenylate cyclase class 1
MGSSAQNRASDVDLWVCCESHLHPALWPKVHAVNHWARIHGVEMQTYLVDPQKFQLGHPIPGCPTPTLLLDEFYRRATLIAGRYPLWWLVPPDAEYRYQSLHDHLIDHRFIERDAVIDFGPVSGFPDSELAKAAETELARALQTPHKSLLKLKLVDVYARTPNEPPISTQYKPAVYAGEQDPDALDAYGCCCNTWKAIAPAAVNSTNCSCSGDCSYAGSPTVPK